MIGISEEDFKIGRKVVQKKLQSHHIDVTDEVLAEITRDIMNISYAKGGGYSAEHISAFAEAYIVSGFHEKYLL